MKKIIGVGKSLEEQQECLKKILLQSQKIKYILETLKKSSLKNYYVAAGCINQTVFNYYHDFDLDYGIKDIDIVYFDLDLSYEAEDKIIKEIQLLFKNNLFNVDIKKQARVHLWYGDKFGFEIKPYTSVEDAISKWGSTVTCIGVRMEKNEVIVYSAYGLDDLFNLIIRPVKGQFTKERYEDKTKKWQDTWPLLKVIPWD
ncbi:MAG: nucleotidyltransferase family protein [Bacilli bacterium]|nr:nucleotidyltransferase family protein [Bacilli bacterium]